MYFLLGSLQFPSGEVSLQSLSSRRAGTRRGDVKLVKTMSVDIEVIPPSSESNPNQWLNTRRQQISTALSQVADGATPQAGFRLNNGGQSGWWLDGVTSLTGIRIKNFSDTQKDPSAYVTHLAFSLQLEAEYPLPGIDDVMAYREEITISGNGGPTYAIVPVFQGPPHRYQLTESSPLVITQSGQAVGFSGYPSVNAPLWPEYENGPARQIKRGSPEREGQNFTEFPVSWGYTFLFGQMPSVPNPLAR